MVFDEDGRWVEFIGEGTNDRVENQGGGKKHGFFFVNSSSKLK
jgi:hypothetical protein